MKVAIIGGGIGGLSAALCLSGYGIEVKVYEQSSSLRQDGAGVVLWNHATLVLRSLGLETDLLSLGCVLNRGDVRNQSGSELASFSLSALSKDTQKTPVLGIRRSALLKLLSKHLSPDVISYNKKVTNFEQTTKGVNIFFQDTSLERADIVIGVDGIHSSIRKILHQEKPRYAGYVGYQGIASLDTSILGHGVANWFMGRGSQFGIIPVGSKDVYWFGTINCPEKAIPSLVNSKKVLRSNFSAWAKPILELVDSLEQDQIVQTPIYDYPPRLEWGRGRVTLLGDAAHATTPTFGHGACLAIESAAVLSAALGQKNLDTEPLVKALRTYEKNRQFKTRGIINHSWLLGRILQSKNRILEQLMNGILFLAPNQWLLAGLRRSIADDFLVNLMTQKDKQFGSADE